ncbi:MAG: hypothetical protein ACREXW_13540 [Gammaproteobacteria bacterium]
MLTADERLKGRCQRGLGARPDADTSCPNHSARKAQTSSHEAFERRIDRALHAGTSRLFQFL